MHDHLMGKTELLLPLLIITLHVSGVWRDQFSAGLRKRRSLISEAWLLIDAIIVRYCITR